MHVVIYEGQLIFNQTKWSATWVAWVGLQSDRSSSMGLPSWVGLSDGCDLGVACVVFRKVPSLWPIRMLRQRGGSTTNKRGEKDGAARGAT